MQSSTLSASEDAIRALAHEYWEEEGRPDGRHEIHWMRAIAFLNQPGMEAAPADGAGSNGMDAATSASARSGHSSDEPAHEDHSPVSDVSLIDGVGPKMKERLAGAGIHSLAQIAAMNLEEISKLDETVGLMGRPIREEWIAQARELIAGLPPRAKSDQATVDADPDD